MIDPSFKSLFALSLMGRELIANKRNDTMSDAIKIVKNRIEKDFWYMAGLAESVCRLSSMPFPSENPSSFLRLSALYMYKGEKKKEDCRFFCPLVGRWSLGFV